MMKTEISKNIRRIDQDKYNRILRLALPFYQNGMPGDVEHIRWLSEVIVRFIDGLIVDFDILIPVILLHDIGYSQIPHGFDPFDLKIRKLHCDEGVKIADEILNKLNYPKDKIDEIKRLILKHDDWAFGDDFADEPILRIFNNFDFMWMASETGFDIVRNFTGKNPVDFYAQIQEFQNKNELDGRPWFNQEIENFYHSLMFERKKGL